MEKILVSACLAGKRCRYDGKDNGVPQIQQLHAEGRCVLVCPEELGGLPTPRTPAEIVGSQVLTKDGQDVTEAFNAGAAAGLKIAQSENIKEAILKAKSPSCGCGQIYDGSFSRKLIVGNGHFAAQLLSAGIKVKTELDL